MKSLRCVLGLLLLSAAFACGGDDEGDEHNFDTYVECYEHSVGEGQSDVGATTECDGFFEISHDDAADCAADHAADVTAGVPQTAIDAHCAEV